VYEVLLIPDLDVHEFVEDTPCHTHMRCDIYLRLSCLVLSFTDLCIWIFFLMLHLVKSLLILLETAC
jgi:hypothetical protein